MWKHRRTTVKPTTGYNTGAFWRPACWQIIDIVSDANKLSSWQNTWQHRCGFICGFNGNERNESVCRLFSRKYESGSHSIWMDLTARRCRRCDVRLDWQAEHTNQPLCRVQLWSCWIIRPFLSTHQSTMKNILRLVCTVQWSRIPWREFWWLLNSEEPRRRVWPSSLCCGK